MLKLLWPHLMLLSNVLWTTIKVSKMKTLQNRFHIEEFHLKVWRFQNNDT